MAARTKCFDCGEPNGLAEYGDGTFCFACKVNHKNKSMFPKEETRKRMTVLDPDLSGEIPQEYLDYLIKYQLVNLAATKARVFWSIQYSRLCFPYYKQINNELKLIGCWMRSLHAKPKWLYYGVDKSKFTWTYFKNSFEDKPMLTHKVILVEDALSALKCSQFYDTICLGGTSLSDVTRRNLSMYNHVIVFTDGDKAGQYAKKIIRDQLKLTHELTILRNKRDPKDYHYNELQEMLK